MVPTVLQLNYDIYRQAGLFLHERSELLEVADAVALLDFHSCCWSSSVQSIQYMSSLTL